jgi:hypothetical protein
VQVRLLPGPLHAFGRTATGAVSRLENGWASRPWGFDSLSFRLYAGDKCPWRHGSLISSRAWFESRVSDFVWGTPRGRMSIAMPVARRSSDNQREEEP